MPAPCLWAHMYPETSCITVVAGVVIMTRNPYCHYLQLVSPRLSKLMLYDKLEHFKHKYSQIHFNK